MWRIMERRRSQEKLQVDHFKVWKLENYIVVLSQVLDNNLWLWLIVDPRRLQVNF